jgi:4'-phosphopantetheinyl transferase
MNVTPLSSPPPGAGRVDWPVGPADPVLAPIAVHVWWADLDVAGGERPCDTLSQDERARAQRMLGARAARRWARSRAVLRALLGRYLHVDPGALRFGVAAHGKPAVADVAGSLSFNLSHSGAVAVYALALDTEVGVDVEVARRPVDVVAIARRTLGAAQARRLAALRADEREREFRRSWVRREARLKCLGAGIGDAGADSGSGSDEDGGGRAAALWIAQLDVGPRAAAAVAARARVGELCCWRWDG